MHNILSFLLIPITVGVLLEMLGEISSSSFVDLRARISSILETHGVPSFKSAHLMYCPVRRTW
jgi:putative effector of murein hydrolase LrgA (UPF0299 family)